MVHARPAYRPGLRRRVGHLYDMAALSAWSGLFSTGSKIRLPRALDALRSWGTTVGGLTVVAAEATPDTVMLEDDLGVLTWREVHERTNRLALGLPVNGPRPRIGLLCRNHRWLVESLIACSKAGIETVLLNTGFGPAQTHAVLSELRVDAIISDGEFAPLLETVPVALRRRVIWVDPPDPGVLTIEQIIEATPYADLAPPPVQGRTIMLSSGTTGRPKGARRPPRPGLWPLASIRSRIPFRAAEAMIIEAPIFHTWGHAAVQIALAMRCRIVLHRRFDPEATLRAIESHPKAVLIAVPIMLQRMMDLAPETRQAYDPGPLRLAVVGGSALPGDLAVRFMDHFGPVLYSVYGSTEASWVAVATPRELRLDPGTAGRPPRNTSMVILDEEDHPVPRGTVGRIFAANEMIFEGYTSGEPVQTWEGLLCTGDLGHIDERGLLRVDGRADGVVVCGGENVVARDVEDLLTRLPGVQEAAVVGVPDPEWGHRLAAYLVPRPGARLDADGVRAYVREQVATFAVPREVYFLAELPRNATGKVLHRALAEARGA